MGCFPLTTTDAELFLSLANLPTRPEMYSYVPPKVASIHDHDDEPSTEGLDGSEMGETTEENGDVMEALSTITAPILTTNPDLGASDLTPDL